MNAAVITEIVTGVVTILGAATALIKAWKTSNKVDDHIATLHAGNEVKP